MRACSPCAGAGTSARFSAAWLRWICRPPIICPIPCRYRCPARWPLPGSWGPSRTPPDHCPIHRLLRPGAVARCRPRWVASRWAWRRSPGRRWPRRLISPPARRPRSRRPHQRRPRLGQRPPPAVCLPGWLAANRPRRRLSRNRKNPLSRLRPSSRRRQLPSCPVPRHRIRCVWCGHPMPMRTRTKRLRAASLYRSRRPPRWRRRRMLLPNRRRSRLHSGCRIRSICPAPAKFPRRSKPRRRRIPHRRPPSLRSRSRSRTGRRVWPSWIRPSIRPWRRRCNRSSPWISRRHPRRRHHRRPARHRPVATWTGH